MIIKAPAIYDVSHWKSIPDFSVISPRPALFITKATEGISIVDVKFIPFFEGAARVGFQRGVFHFHRRVMHPVRQAKHFCDTIRGHITDKDFLILDVEEGEEQASQLWAFLEYVHAQFPRNRRIIYGRKNLLDPIPMNESEKAYFRQIPIWVAGYPTFPDLYSAIPAGYIPDRTKWGPVWLWQYSSHGAVTGIVGDVDLNLATPEFLPILYSGVGDPDPMPLPEPEEPMPITFTGKVKDTSVQRPFVRVHGDTTASIITTLAPGTEFTAQGVKVTNDGFDWLNIVTPVLGWLALTSLIEYQPVTSPAPTPADTVRVSLDMDVSAEIGGKRYTATVVVADVVMREAGE